ncbi:MULTISPECIES: polyprenyl synthetase family protein [unclassified Nocardia]|uniref:polyprenyl synthetase family protein n=1 Tax=unclassified Nocardia TaxID=2637762 RepID=UPI0034372814
MRLSTSEAGIEGRVVGITRYESGSRTAATVLDEARRLVEPAYRSSLDRIAPPIRMIVGYHAGWLDATGRPSKQVGKSIRPALVLASAKAVAAAEPPQGVTEAVAVELVHDFSLLQDDLIDGDEQRRNRRSAWSVFGERGAQLAGDALLAMAINEMVGRPGITLLSKALDALCNEQCADIESEQRETVDESLAMIESKTAALLSCACEMGAIAGGADPAQARALAEFGHHLGIAFQLIDDMLGIWGNPSMTGKPLYPDLANRRKSPPIARALDSPGPTADALRELYRDVGRDAETLHRIACLIELTGAREWARREAQRQLAAALDCLTEVSANNATEDLRLLAAMMTSRSA